MQSFIKQNASLVLALALPLILAVFFLISKQVSVTDHPPPAHDFILGQDYSYDQRFEIAVVNDRLSVKFNYPTAQEAQNIAPIKAPDLYLVNAKTLVAEPITLELPADARSPGPGKHGTAIQLSVPKLESLKLTPVKIAPDGYELDAYGYYRDGNLMTEIFSARNHNSYGPTLRKDGTRHDIKGLDMHSSNLTVIGWVVP